jgi:hypothetical protein
MLQYLKDEDILDEETTVPDAQKFIENHIKGEEIYDFYVLLRRAVTVGSRKKAKS